MHPFHYLVSTHFNREFPFLELQLLDLYFASLGTLERTNYE